MKKLHKRFLSALLALTMAVTLCVPALAAESSKSYSADFMADLPNWVMSCDNDNVYGVPVDVQGVRKLYPRTNYLNDNGTSVYKLIETNGADFAVNRLGVEVPQGATEISADRYDTQLYGAYCAFLEKGNFANIPDAAHDALTGPVKYYLITSGYTARAYKDQYGGTEYLYSKGDDNFVITSRLKTVKSGGISGFVDVVHYKYKHAALPTSSYSFSGEQPSGWAKAGVSDAINKGIVPASLRSGYKNTITRAEFCALVVALMENYYNEEIEDRETFTDTTDVNVEKAAAMGVVGGVGNGKFNPNGKLTREQAATMLSRLCVSLWHPAQSDGAVTFADKGSVSSWAMEGVADMQDSGIMGGVGDNKFDPKGAYTREQSILTMLRVYNLLHPTADKPVFTPMVVEKQGLTPDQVQRILDLAEVEALEADIEHHMASMNQGFALFQRSYLQDMQINILNVENMLNDILKNGYKDYEEFAELRALLEEALENYYIVMDMAKASDPDVEGMRPYLDKADELLHEHNELIKTM